MWKQHAPVPDWTMRPFTRADAVARGLDLRLLRGSRFRRIFRGVMIAREVVDTRGMRIAAGLKLVADGSYASHYSAAHLYGVPVPGQPEVHVSVPSPFHRSRVTGVKTHRAWEEPDLGRVDGNPVSSPVQMFLETVRRADARRPGGRRGQPRASWSGEHRGAEADELRLRGRRRA